MTLLHAADLHLRAEGRERDYGLAVLDEIISIARQERADVLLFAGDLFESYDDAEALRSVVAEKIAELPTGTAAYLLPGNHEFLRAGGRRFHRLEFGRMAVAAEEPLSISRVHDAELLFVPHQAGYGNYAEWGVPARKLRHRVVVAHATVAGLFFDESGEEGTSFMDADLLSHLEADYVALGHIHAGRSFTVGEPREGRASRVDAVYPGSARVWRKGESGPRSVALVTLDDAGVEWHLRTLSTAGEYRSVVVLVEPDGSIGTDLEAIPLGPADYASCSLVGVVEDDATLRRVAEEVHQVLAARSRVIEVTTEDAVLIDGVSEEPIVRRFLEVWRRHGESLRTGDEDARRLWYRAREVGLRTVKQVIEQKR
ncbi:MAG: exonuclease SbcCD subunit D [Spirochaetaceae bacterium]